MLALSLLTATAAGGASSHAAGDTKRACVYSAHSIGVLHSFDRLVHRDFNCALVFNNAAPHWWDWETPWFARHIKPDTDWAKWATQPGTNRQLIISQSLFPDSLNHRNWRQAGARGRYMGHARALARYLVSQGLGSSVIRLSHEANGTWGPDNIGTTRRQFRLWVRFWRNTVIAMRSVRGANFKFDWCINAAVRAIPLKDFYPGDDVVDIIGVDAYDSGVKGTGDRWSTIFNRPDGVKDVIAFARAHHKPMSIPEWGVAPTWKAESGGDDAEYVNGIAGVVRDNPVAYQSYFFNHQWASQLVHGARSLAAYKRHFGGSGDSVGH